MTAKERPILYSGEMMRAKLAGLKTMTRRTRGLDKINENPDQYKFGGFVRLGKELDLHAVFQDRNTDEIIQIKSPYGKAGDRLWSRENCYEDCLGSISIARHEADGAPAYRNDGSLVSAGWWYSKPVCPSIHMPRWVCRDVSEITNIRIERVQDITEQDAIAEGVWKYGDENCYKIYTPTTSFGTSCPIRSFRSLWESINGPDSWNENKWVWVIEFRALEQAND